jgi:hypothetical protein
MCAALAKHGVDYTIVRWIRATLEGQLAMATVGGLQFNLFYFPKIYYKAIATWI